MEGKTPVTLLQEYLLKMSEVPDYKLVYNGVGTHDPLFKYQVTAKNKSAIGNGKSKKEAKHDAARQLLLLLKDERFLEEEVQVVSPYADSIKENAVGALQDFCLAHSTSAPRYDLIREEGLAHAKIFGYRCTVSSFTTEAEARTKKQAKQQASHNMLLKLQKCLSDGIEVVSSSKEQIDCVDSATLTKKARDVTKEAYEKISKEREGNDKDKFSSYKLGTSLSHFAEQFLENVLPFSETLGAIKNCDSDFLEKHEAPEELLKSIVSQLDYTYSFGSMNSRTEEHVCYVHIRELNRATFAGISLSKDEAKRKAVISCLKFLITMSQN